VFNYIEQFEDGSLAITSSNEQLDGNPEYCNPDVKKRIELSENDFNKYSAEINYIDCCFLDERDKLVVDITKVLSRKLEVLTADINERCAHLRRLIQEAGVMDKKEVAQEIAGVMKTLRAFINESDFSNVKDISSIEQITCPELNIDYDAYFSDKIYGI